MSACVLPLAPEFQDPPAAQNFAPRITNSVPPLGSVVVSTETVVTFRVTVTDPNLGDDLFVLWVADFPRISSNTRPLNNQFVPHPTNGQPLGQEVSEMLSCVGGNLAPIATHQVMVIVADRELPNPPTDNDYTIVPPPGLSVVGSWTLNLNCGAP